jgi:predicted O-methyltransferase YrrM
MDELVSIEPPEAIAGIVAATEALGFGMASEPRTGALLRALAASKPGGRLLELGTGSGLATAWLLSGMDADSTLVSVDTDPEVQAIARKHLGEDLRLTLVNEDGRNFLRRQASHSFDLVFADAMPGKYEGLDEALAVVKAGGFYVIDDMLPQPNWPEGHAAKIPTLMEQLAARSEFSLAALTWSTGVVIAVRKTVGRIYKQD